MKNSNFDAPQFLKRPAMLSLSKFLSVVCLVLFCHFTNAQTKIITKIDTTAKAIYADNLDQVYLLTSNDELLKYDVNGKLKWRYSNNRFGKLLSVDVSDPMRVILYYADFQQLIVLNNNLNEITSYSFAQNTNEQITHVASANNNGYWVYDRLNNVLKKLSANFASDMRSSNLNQLFSEVFKPKKLQASDQFVYLQNADNDIFQFDRFATFLKKMPIDSVSDFNIAQNNLAYLNKNELILYNPQSFELTKTALPLNVDVKQVVIGNKIIVALTEKAVFLLSR